MIIAINKPVGPTSFDIVAKVRKISGIKKVGHAGTLDPLASGVLVVAIGRESTKMINSIVEKEKEYIAEIKLGETSTTDDGEGVLSANHENIKALKQGIIKSVHQEIPSLNQVKEVVTKFIGEIDQVPPAYSAIKVGGKRAYKLARLGKEVEMKSRKVLIKDIELLNYDYPNLKIKVTTGPGVYIRSLARDIGQELRTGAYMSGLERTRVGEYRLEDCVEINSLSSVISTEAT